MSKKHPTISLNLAKPTFCLLAMNNSLQMQFNCSQAKGILYVGRVCFIVTLMNKTNMLIKSIFYFISIEFKSCYLL